jgi:hypothetical protein
MRRLSRKAALLVLPCALAFTAWMASEPQPAYAAITYCADRHGRLCFSEGQQIECTYIGCCLYIGYGSCACENGRWNCGDSGVHPECPQPGEPDYYC